MVKPVILHSGNGHFLWNLSNDVGPNCANNQDDVELVRFGIFCLGTNPTFQGDINIKARCAMVPLLGGFDQNLADLIKLLQQARGGTQDGKVSPMKDGDGFYDGSHKWMIFNFNIHMFQVVGALWPRIDLHHATSARLTEVIKTVFTLG